MKIEQIGNGYYKEAFRSAITDFMKNPIAFLAGAIGILLASILLGYIPFIGSFLFGVISPFLFAGFLLLTDEIEKGEEGNVETLLEGFKDSRFFEHFLVLGLAAGGVGAVSSLVVYLVTTLFVSLSGVGLAFLMYLNVFLIFIVATIFSLVIWLLLQFSVKLILFNQQTATVAIKNGLTAIMNNKSEIIKIYVAIIVIGIISSLLMMMLPQIDILIKVVSYLLVLGLFPIFIIAVYKLSQKIFLEE